MAPSAGFLLIDANVLVDYLATDVTVLTLVSKHIGQVNIVSTVLDEVTDLDEALCEHLGFRVVEPTLEQAITAAEHRGRLSFEDKTCLLVCKDQGWTCVTNDKALRKACTKDGVSVLWGLKVMVELVRIGQLSPEEAIRVAHLIQEQNAAFITQAIMRAFREKVENLQKASN